MPGTLLISHIPKTAGTSLKRLVERHEPGTALVYAGELALGNPDLEFIAAFRAKPAPAVVMGHFSYGVHRFLRVPPRYATVLREPVARVVSLYHFLKIDSRTALGDRLRAGLSLADFVTSAETEMSNNHMCRCIAGIPPDAGMVINEPWLLDLACHNLRNHYEIVGTVERGADMVRDFSRALGWTEQTLPSLNVADLKAPDLDRRTSDMVRAYNALDLKLYELVLAGQIGRSASAPP